MPNTGNDFNTIAQDGQFIRSDAVFVQIFEPDQSRYTSTHNILSCRTKKKNTNADEGR